VRDCTPVLLVHVVLIAEQVEDSRKHMLQLCSFLKCTLLRATANILYLPRQAY